MNAINELRRLLDERGVEHTDTFDLTEWVDDQGRTVIATDILMGIRLSHQKMIVRRVMTPEQVINETLGEDKITTLDIDKFKNKINEILDVAYLESENDNLRKQGVRLLDKTLELASENDKLRELLQDTFIQTDQYCDKYGIEYADRANAFWKANDDIDRRLRELGIEVD